GLDTELDKQAIKQLVDPLALYKPHSVAIIERRSKLLVKHLIVIDVADLCFLYLEKMKQFGSTTFQGIQDTKLLQILMELSSNQTGNKIRDYRQIQLPWASTEKQPVVKGASLNSGNSSSDWGAETVKFQTKISGNGKWQGSEVRRVIDKEFDVVVVPSDGIHLSGYESDGPLGGKNPSALAFMVMKMMVDTLFSFLVINVVTRSL
ncbi:hypothetical protein Golob_016647, partial [Gossypium lobatum]|nr:hypothetical protein [Gossypium lobatum]